MWCDSPDKLCHHSDQTLIMALLTPNVVSLPGHEKECHNKSTANGNADSALPSALQSNDKFTRLKMAAWSFGWVKYKKWQLKLIRQNSTCLEAFASWCEGQGQVELKVCQRLELKIWFCTFLFASRTRCTAHIYNWGEIIVMDEMQFGIKIKDPAQIATHYHWRLWFWFLSFSQFFTIKYIWNSNNLCCVFTRP